MRKILFFVVIIFISLVSLSGEAKTTCYTKPDGEKGWYQRGLGWENDGVIDMRKCYGVGFTVHAKSDTKVRVVLKRLRQSAEGRRDLPDSTQVSLKVTGPFPRKVVIPLDAFDYNRGQAYFLKFIKTIKVDAAKDVAISNITPMEGHTFALHCDVKGKSLSDGNEACYTIKVKNVTETRQSAIVDAVRRGWEGMTVTVSSPSLILEPNETKEVEVLVKGNGEIIPGMNEEQVIAVTPVEAFGRTETITLTTVVAVASPFLIHTSEEWEEIKDNIKKYDWASAELEKLVRIAENFNIPEIRKQRPGDKGHEGIVRAYIEGPLVATAEVFYLTGNRVFGEKVAETLRRISNPEEGYLRTNHLTFQGIPQEGGTMEGLLHAYDLIKNAGFLTPEEEENVEAVFRRFCENFLDMMGDGGVSNWTVFNHGPAAQCALLLGDLDMFKQFAYAPCGLVDHLKYGTLDDGWWYEMSLSYNLGCASCYTMVAKAASLFGIDWINGSFPTALTKNVGLRPFEYENFQGMAFGKFGSISHPGITIKRMWDGILPYPDYRGVMFGMGDGHEHVVSGNQFEMAYYVFRDPAYVSIIKRAPTRNLIWGVSELPEHTVDRSAQSAYSPDAGISVLRSQAGGRDQSEQIQVAVKYGTHGSYHGHFDQLSLLSLMRYGRSFYNPETSWWGYGSYMYKWWVQPSMSHNMVVVDGLQKEPTECRQNLFYSGDMIQALDVSTISRWSNPPYMGGYDHIEGVLRHDIPYVEIPADHPAPTEIGAYSEPVFQRRLTIVTDDYVLLADYLEAASPHTFDNLFHLRGVYALEKTIGKGHEAKFDNSPLSAGQFITSVDNYDYQPGGVVKSVHHFAPQGENGMNMVHGNWETGGQNRLYNTAGDLYIDVYPIEPQKGILRIGDYAENWNNGRKIQYVILAGGKKIAADTVNSWILGESRVRASLDHPRTLSIQVNVDRSSWGRSSTLFADAFVLTSGGKKVRLSSLPSTFDKIKPLPNETADYEGGPIKIAGHCYGHAVGLEPTDNKVTGTVTFDLSGVDAVGLEGVVGCDFFNGDEEQLRRTVALRQTGKTAAFITLVEPHEGTPMVRKVKSVGNGKVEVMLADGRRQEIEIRDFCGRSDSPVVSVREYAKGKLVREEATVR